MDKAQATIIKDLINPLTPADRRRMLEDNAIELGGTGADAAMRAHLNTVADPDARLGLLRQYHPEAIMLQPEGEGSDPYYVISNPDYTPEKFKSDGVKPLMLVDPSTFEAGDIAEAATSALPVAASVAGGIGGAFVGLPAGPAASIGLGSLGGAVAAEGVNKLQQNAFDLIMGKDADRGTFAEQLKESGANIVFDTALGFVVDIPGVGLRRIGQKTLRTALRRVLKRKSDAPFQQVAADAIPAGGKIIPGSETTRTLKGGDTVKSGRIALPDGGEAPYNIITVKTKLPKQKLKNATPEELAAGDKVMNSELEAMAATANAKYAGNAEFPNARIILEADQTYEDIAKRGLLQAQDALDLPEATDATASQFRVPLTRLSGSPAMHAIEDTIGKKGAARDIIGDSVARFRGEVIDKMDEAVENINKATMEPTSFDTYAAQNMASGTTSPVIGNRATIEGGIIPATQQIPAPKIKDQMGATARRKEAGNILKRGLGAKLDQAEKLQAFHLKTAIMKADPQKVSSTMPQFRQFFENLNRSVGRAGDLAPEGQRAALEESRKIMAILDEKGTAGTLSLAELRTVKAGIDEALNKTKVAGGGSVFPGGNRELLELSRTIDSEITSAIRSSGSKEAIKSLDTLQELSDKNQPFRAFMREFNATGGDREAYDFVMSDAKDAGKKLKTALDAMPDEYKAAYRTSVIGTMGRTKPDGTEVAWNGKLFFDDYNSMQPAVKDQIFGKVGDSKTGIYRKNLDTLATIAKNFDEGTAYVTPGMDGITASHIFTYPLMGAGYAAGGGLGLAAGAMVPLSVRALSSKSMADLITNPEFVKWTLGMSKMKWTYRKPPHKQFAGQIARLTSIVSENPELANPVFEYIQWVKGAFGNLALDTAGDAGEWTTEKFLENWKNLDKATQKRMLEAAGKEQRGERETYGKAPTTWFGGF